MTTTKLYRVYFMSEWSYQHSDTEEPDLAGYIHLTEEQKQILETRHHAMEENAWEATFELEEVEPSLTFDQVVTVVFGEEDEKIQST